ncbi:MAG: large conductance mechanosensitive channel protein MscL [Candidatus Aenigmatarchaeota archaeon]
MGLIAEFKQFLDEYKVMGLAIAFIIGAALTTLVQSLVNDIIMPIVSPALSATGDWKASVFQIGPITLKWGSFLGAIINFVIIAFVIFMIAKLILREPKVAKK